MPEVWCDVLLPYANKTFLNFIFALLDSIMCRGNTGQTGLASRSATLSGKWPASRARQPRYYFGSLTSDTPVIKNKSSLKDPRIQVTQQSNVLPFYHQFQLDLVQFGLFCIDGLKWPKY